MSSSESHSRLTTQSNHSQQATSSTQLQSDLRNHDTSLPSQPQPLPLKPTRAQLKNQSRVLDSFLPSSQKVNIAQFAKQTYQLLKPSKDFDLNDWSTDLPSNQLDSLIRSCSLLDLTTPLVPIYKDSNLISELRDHQHELATPYGSLHALHTLDQSSRPEDLEESIPVHDTQPDPRPTKRPRFLEQTPTPSLASILETRQRNSSSFAQTSTSDIPVTPLQAPDYLDPTLFSRPPSTSLSTIATTSYQKPNEQTTSTKPKRIRKKAAGPRVPIEEKPDQIKHLIGRLEATELRTLKQSYDGMHFVKAVGRSDWNTSTQPIFSTLPTARVKELNELAVKRPSQPAVLLTITFHPLARSIDRATSTITERETKAIAPRQQTIHILSTQTLAELKDSVVCAADYIPRHDGTSWLSEKWDAGCVLALEGVCYPDRRGLGVAGKSDYGQLLQRLTQLMAPGGPEIIEQETQTNEASSDIQVNEPKSNANSRPQLILSSTGMESIRFEELELQVGEPYWMLHQGNCEHIFTVDEIRAVHPTDPTLPKVPNGNILPTSIEGCYPITTFLSRLASPKCRVCDRDPAKLVIMNDELVDESPCFVCERCFELLHGHEAGFRIGKVVGREWWVVPLLGS